MTITKRGAILAMILIAWFIRLAPVTATSAGLYTITCTPDDQNQLPGGCYCSCPTPDACGGNSENCEIGGFNQTACYMCFGGNSPQDWTSDIVYCYDHEADFHCGGDIGG